MARKPKATENAYGLAMTAVPPPDPMGDGIADAFDKPMPRTLDARPDRFDFRDLAYLPPLRSLPPMAPSEADLKRFLPAYVKAGLILNQGTEGACTGFGLAGVANYLLWRRHVESGARGKFEPVSARMFYTVARHYDEWPGQDYDGSSCRGALKGWNKHGVCSDALWPYPLKADGKPIFVRPKTGWAEDATRRPLGVYYRINRRSVVDMQAAINEIGAVYIQATVHDGWQSLTHEEPTPAPKRHADLPVIPPVKDPSQNGGHSVALVGYNDRGFIVQNSWGPVWGAGGFGVLPYDDWALNGVDAWAVALGVPQDLNCLRAANRARSDAGFRVGQAMGLLSGSARNPANPADDPWPFDHPFKTPAYQPWTTTTAYRHTLVSGNDGQLMVSDFTRERRDGAGHARELILERPLAFAKGFKLKTFKLALYAQGGLDGETSALKRIRVLGPCFEANGVYPLFLTWKTGAGEILGSLMQDWSRRLHGGEASSPGQASARLTDAKDRALETSARLLGRGIWSEMRENASLAAYPGHVLQQAADQLRALRAALAKAGIAFELHLIGHSAGAQLLGELLDLLCRDEPLPVASCELHAPACSVAFANQHFLAAAASGVLPLERLHLAVLSDQNEKSDGLPSRSAALYGKSLLYLVSRSLEDVRKMPLLGMERALLKRFAQDGEQWDPGQKAELRRWHKAWGTLDGSHPRGVVVSDPKLRNTREQGQCDATHGSFDNNLDLMTAAIERIKGASLIAPLEWLDF